MTSADESIFVWDLEVPKDGASIATYVHQGLLAKSPAAFAKCGDVTYTGRSQGFAINQFGLAIRVPATTVALGVHQAHLNVTKGAQSNGRCALLLANLRDDRGFARTMTPSGESIVMTVKHADSLREFVVPLKPSATTLNLYPGFWLRKLDFYGKHVGAHRYLNRRTADQDRFLLPEGKVGTAGIVMLSLWNGFRKAAGYGYIRLGFDLTSHRPVCQVVFPSDYDWGARKQKLLAEAERAEELLTMETASPRGLNHPIFSDDWITTRQLAADSSDGFNSTFHGLLFGVNIDISVRRVPDVTSVRGRQGEVWAVDMMAGSRPPSTWTQYPRVFRSCCRRLEPIVIYVCFWFDVPLPNIRARPCRVGMFNVVV